MVQDSNAALRGGEEGMMSADSSKLDLMLALLDDDPEVGEARAELAALRDTLQSWFDLWSYICKATNCDGYLPNKQNFDSMIDNAPRYVALRATVTRQAGRIADAETVAIRLIGRIRKIHESSEYRAVWECAQAHRGPYRGESYEDELNALAAWLASTAPDASQGCTCTCLVCADGDHCGQHGSLDAGGSSECNLAPKPAPQADRDAANRDGWHDRIDALPVAPVPDERMWDE